ncbi:MAG TPA: putative capsular polysaccharide synthesis family protein [Pyrinomonadaceae bacterium]
MRIIASAAGLLRRARLECWYRLLVWRAAVSPRQIVLVYQMGKVASSSITQALRRVVGLRVFQLHLLSPDGARRLRARMRRKGASAADAEMYVLARTLHRGIVKAGRKAKVVTLVREPIGRNISFYFQNLDMLWETADAHEKVGLGRMLEEFLDRFNHDDTLEWFDSEFKAALGVDIYAHEFPHALGHLRLDTGRHEILVLRSDLDDAAKAKCLAEFLGVEGVTLVRENASGQKPYADAHREFLRELRLPEEYVSHMLDSKYARHFFSPEERDALRSKWLREGGNSRGTRL